MSWYENMRRPSAVIGGTTGGSPSPARGRQGNERGGSGLDRLGRRRPLHQTSLAVGRLVLVDDALGRRLVDALDGQTDRLFSVLGPALDSSDGPLGSGA